MEARPTSGSLPWRHGTARRISLMRNVPLALTEAATRLSDRPDAVSKEVWDEAARLYDERALAILVTNIALINFWNRLNVTTAQVAGEWAKSPEAQKWVKQSSAAR
jgi:alkylhydroperoxidase family enzyme